MADQFDQFDKDLSYLLKNLRDKNELKIEEFLGKGDRQAVLRAALTSCLQNGSHELAAEAIRYWVQFFPVTRHTQEDISSDLALIYRNGRPETVEFSLASGVHPDDWEDLSLAAIEKDDVEMMELLESTHLEWNDMSLFEDLNLLEDLIAAASKHSASDCLAYLSEKSDELESA